MSFVIVLFPEPRDVFIDDRPQGSSKAASGRPRAVRQRGVPRLSPGRPGRCAAAGADARRAGAANPQSLPRRVQENLMRTGWALAAAVALVAFAGCAGP